jgi:hypothetical protein
MASLGRIAAMNVKRRGTSQGAMVSVTITWLTMQLIFHLQQQQQQQQGTAAAVNNGSSVHCFHGRLQPVSAVACVHEAVQHQILIAAMHSSPAV